VRSEAWGALWVVNVAGLVLEVGAGWGYPSGVPNLIRVIGQDVSEGEAMWLVKALFEVAQTLLGGAMVFELVSWLENNRAGEVQKRQKALAKYTASGNQANSGNDDDWDTSSEASAATTRTAVDSQAGSSSKGASTSRNRAQSRGFGSADFVASECKKLAEQLQGLQLSSEYKGMAQARQKLPAHSMRSEVVEACAQNQVVLICGTTGCGKTTQVPQFILEEAFGAGQGGKCSIICTQPRRISALGVAERVAAERCCKVGSLVGYQIRLESKKSRDTRLLFCTTGVLLRRLMDDTELDGISHVVVDEVHERTIDGDFLLVILKRLCARRRDLRVVLMSATADADKFSKYFGVCKVVTIPGFTHPVKEVFLETALSMTGQLIGRGSPYALSRDAFLRRKKAFETTGEFLPAIANGEEDDSGDGAGGQQDASAGKDERLDHVQISLLNVDESKINYDLLEGVLEHMHGDSNYDIDSRGTKGSVLMFLPGIAEIQRAYDRVQELSRKGSAGALWPVPVHGSLSPADQKKVFQKPPGGARKVVLATNICETSITIDDCIAVIDTGRAREMTYDAHSGLSRLQDAWVARAAATQRQGRAGRVRPGVCFRYFDDAPACICLIVYVCACVCVCVCVYIDIYIYIYIYIYTHTHTHTYIYIYTHTHTHTHTNIHRHIHTSMHTYIRCVYAY
jgi:HrpA-like RNA helicase